MAAIYLIRHGQASLGADNYDQLSDKGLKQASLLGQFFNRQGVDFSRAYCGQLVRQRQTLEGILAAADEQSYQQLSGLNEYQFQSLFAQLSRDFPQQILSTAQPHQDFVHNLKASIRLWMDGEIATDGKQSWEQFYQQTGDCFREICAQAKGNVLIVSSGGVIAAILSRILKLDKATTLKMALQIQNAGITRVLSSKGNYSLDCFNDLSHLAVFNQFDLATYA